MRTQRSSTTRGGGRAALRERTLHAASQPLRLERGFGRSQAPATLQTPLLGRLCRRLESIAQHLGRDELAVLTLVAERLRSGRSIYGELGLGTDRRDLQHEARKEAADLAM
jgi:hypothetical protein